MLKIIKNLLVFIFKKKRKAKKDDTNYPMW